MNFSEQLDSGMNTELSMTNEAKSFLLTTCKWTKFLSIVGFVFLVLLALVALAIGFIGFDFGEVREFNGMKYIMMFMYLALALIYFFPTLYLYRFSVLTKQGIENTSSDLLTSGFENLKSCFKFFGVFTAIVIGIYGLLFIIGMFGAMMS